MLHHLDQTLLNDHTFHSGFSLLSSCCSGFWKAPGLFPAGISETCNLQPVFSRPSTYGPTWVLACTKPFPAVLSANTSAFSQPWDSQYPGSHFLLPLLYHLKMTPDITSSLLLYQEAQLSTTAVIKMHLLVSCYYI